MTVPILLASLASVTQWSPEQAARATDFDEISDPQVICWIIELAETMENYIHKRMVAIYMTELMCSTGKSLEEIKALMTVATSYDGFTPMDILGLGLAQQATEKVHELLGTKRGQELQRMRNSGPFAGSTPRHALPDYIYFCLSGQDGLMLAWRWEEHIARCEGCRENAIAGYKSLLQLEQADRTVGHYI